MKSRRAPRASGSVLSPVRFSFRFVLVFFRSIHPVDIPVLKRKVGGRTEERGDRVLFTRRGREVVPEEPRRFGAPSSGRRAGALAPRYLLLAMLILLLLFLFKFFPDVLENGGGGPPAPKRREQSGTVFCSDGPPPPPPLGPVQTLVQQRSRFYAPPPHPRACGTVSLLLAAEKVKGGMSA